jgi:TonB family protein
MNSRAVTRKLISTFSVLLLPLVSHVQGGSLAYLGSKGGSAVDIKGVRHTASEYPGHHPPWLDDRLLAVAPNYPYADRARYHQGVGVFRLTLDPRTGAVSKVAMLKSTAFASLDGSAVASFRRWRWKPGKWKEIDMPITFEMASGPPRRLPPGAARLPPP